MQLTDEIILDADIDAGVDPGMSMVDELFDRVDGLTEADLVNSHVMDDVLDDDPTHAAGPVTAGPMLRIADPDRSIIEVPDGATVWIGRSPVAAPDELSVTVAHPLVSRRHLVVTATNGALIADDLGSRNGTVVRRGNQTITIGNGFRLEPGDRVTSGDGTPLISVEPVI